MDILAALEASASPAKVGRCKVQKTLDQIPDDAPGKGVLEEAVHDQTGEWANLRVAVVFANLGLSVSASSIGSHRRSMCLCYGIGS
jgi:hypothetical protein